MSVSFRIEALLEWVLYLESELKLTITTVLQIQQTTSGYFLIFVSFRIEALLEWVLYLESELKLTITTVLQIQQTTSGYFLIFPRK